MPKGPLGGPRPFAENNVTIEFSGASPTGLDGEDAEIESRIQEAVSGASPRGAEPPRVDLEVKEVEVGSLTDTEAHVHLDQEFIELHTLDAVRRVVESEYSTSGGQIK